MKFSATIAKYLAVRFLKKQFFISCFLFFVFFCQKIIQVLYLILDVNYKLPLLFLLIGLFLLDLAKLIFPLGLFLGLLLTLKELYDQHEIIAIYSCGLKRSFIFLVAFLVSSITFLFVLIHIVWLSPFTSSYRHQLLFSIKNKDNFSSIMEGQFQIFKKSNITIFVNKIQNEIYKDIFIVKFKLDSNHLDYFIVANRGYFCEVKYYDNLRSFILFDGSYYTGFDNNCCIYKNICIMHFAYNEFSLMNNTCNYYRNNVDQWSINKLLHSKQSEAIAELHWRLTLLAAVLIMTVIAVLFSVRKINIFNNLNIILALLLYLFFFVIQVFFCFHFYKNHENFVFFVWIINSAYLFIVFIFNCYDYFKFKFLLKMFLCTDI